MKNFKLCFLIFFLHFFCFFSQLDAQSISGLKYFDVSFDSTQNSSPMFLSGEIDNANEISGLMFELSETQNGNEIISDTLFVIDKQGYFYTSYKGDQIPSNALNFTRIIPISTSFHGLLYLKIVIIYKNGLNSEKIVYKVKK